MLFTMQLTIHRLNFVWISSILTTNLFEILNCEICNSSKSKNKFANSRFANRDSATNCTTRFPFGVCVCACLLLIVSLLYGDLENQAPEGL